MTCWQVVQRGVTLEEASENMRGTYLLRRNRAGSAAVSQHGGPEGSTEPIELFLTIRRNTWASTVAPESFRSEKPLESAPILAESSPSS